MKRYATEARLGHKPTVQDIARIHNGGPNGYKLAATVGYWNLVKAELETKKDVCKAVKDGTAVITFPWAQPDFNLILREKQFKNYSIVKAPSNETKNEKMKTQEQFICNALFV